MKATLHPGLTQRLEYAVTPERTVPHVLPEAGEFSALPEVFATAYLVAVVEWTCVRALIGHLDDDETTLGVHVDLSHDAPTPSGAIVTIEVELAHVEGRQLTFVVRAHDDAAVISSGTHRRAVVNIDRFQARLRERAARTGESS